MAALTHPPRPEGGRLLGTLEVSWGIARIDADSPIPALAGSGQPDPPWTGDMDDPGEPETVTAHGGRILYVFVPDDEIYVSLIYWEAGAWRTLSAVDLNAAILAALDVRFTH